MVWVPALESECGTVASPDGSNIKQYSKYVLVKWQINIIISHSE